MVQIHSKLTVIVTVTWDEPVLDVPSMCPESIQYTVNTTDVGMLLLSTSYSVLNVITPDESIAKRSLLLTAWKSYDMVSPASSSVHVKPGANETAPFWNWKKVILHWDKQNYTERNQTRTKWVSKSTSYARYVNCINSMPLIWPARFYFFSKISLLNSSCDSLQTSDELRSHFPVRCEISLW